MYNIPIITSLIHTIQRFKWHLQTIYFHCCCFIIIIPHYPNILHHSPPSQVVKLNLQHNELTQIPRCLLELPSLSEFNLSHNRLSDIPDVPEWSSCLAVLNLSHNSLQSMPLSVMPPSIRTPGISHNQFCTVPLCICSFTSLVSLDLSYNHDFCTYPAEIGRGGSKFPA